MPVRLMPNVPQTLTTSFWNSPFLTKGLKVLEKPAYKYAALSLITMGIPRAYVDFTRNDAIGWETTRYELAGTAINYLLPGFIAYGIGKLVEKTNAPPGIQTAFWADNRSIEALYENWKKTGATPGFIRETLAQIEGDTGKDRLKKQAGQLERIISDNSLNKKEVKSGLEDIKTSIARQLGVRDNIKLSGSGVYTSVDKLVDNIYDMTGKIFNESSELTEKAIAKLKLTNNVKTVGALAIAGAMTFGQQFVNRFITREETGMEGYIGYSDLKDKLRYSEWQKNNNVDTKQPAFTGYGTSGYGFDGIFPNNTQIAGYMAPLSFLGALSAARDENELLERFIRNGSALVNIFLIPGIAGKIAALFTKEKDDIMDKPGRFSDILSNRVKSYKEIEAYAYKTGKSFDKLIKAKNMTKFAELAYALIAVGLAVPWFTKTIVDKQHEKELRLNGQLAENRGNSLLVKNSGIIKNMTQNPGSQKPFDDFIRLHSG